MSYTEYICIDDPLEEAVVTGREKTPNGRIFFDIIKPTSSTGHQLKAPAFYAKYQEKNKPDTTLDRPTSMSSKEDWRKWALQLERQNAELLSDLEHR